MAFTVEDGTGITDANALIEESFADTYHADRGNTSWAAVTSADKKIAIIQATDYVSRRFEERFKGQKEFDVNILPFPRLYLYDNAGNKVEGIPTKVKMAVAEYALRALTDTLMPDPVVGEEGQLLTRKIDKVGPIEEHTHFWAAQRSVFKTYPEADRLLRDYLFSVGSVYR